MDRVGWRMYHQESADARARERRARVGGKDVAHAAVDKARGLLEKGPVDQPNSLGIALHYALGVLPGSVYAVLRERFPGLRAGNGFLYGLVLFVLMDEVVAPLLGLASAPQKYPVQAHARGLVSHVALGIATESVLELSARRSGANAAREAGAKG